MSNEMMYEELLTAYKIAVGALCQSVRKLEEQMVKEHGPHCMGMRVHYSAPFEWHKPLRRFSLPRELASLEGALIEREEFLRANCSKVVRKPSKSVTASKNAKPSSSKKAYEIASPPPPQTEWCSPITGTTPFRFGSPNRQSMPQLSSDTEIGTGFDPEYPDDTRGKPFWI